MVVSCGICDKEDVRIYRPYGTFYRPETNRCNNCLTSELDKRGWYVPCILDEDGTVWGYTSAPQDAINKFYALPESNPKKPIWDSDRDSWSDSEI